MRPILWFLSIIGILAVVLGILAIVLGDWSGGLPGAVIGLATLFVARVLARSDRRDR